MFSASLDFRVAEDAFAKLAELAGEMRPVLGDIGEAMVVSSKERFVIGVAPDGTRWAPNSEVTYLRYLDKYATSYSKKTGKITSTGAGRASGKQPLIGESRALSTQIHYRVDGNAVAIGSPMEYAAVQQFGAAARSFTGGKTPWGDIPARPFLGMSDHDRQVVTEIVQDEIRRRIGG